MGRDMLRWDEKLSSFCDGWMFGLDIGRMSNSVQWAPGLLFDSSMYRHDPYRHTGHFV